MAHYANPTPSKVAKSPLKVDRKVMCADYQGCLDETVKRNWAGFSCRKCRAYRPLEFDSSEWLADSLACIALMCVAEFQTSYKQKSRGGIVVQFQHEARKPQWALALNKKGQA
jgi:hypothetical protein